MKQSRDSPEASRIISAKKAGSTKATSHVTKPDGQFASSSSEKGSEIREKFADPHNIGQADANVEGYEATQQSKDNSGLAKTASTEYLVQLYQRTEASEHIQEFIDIFRANKVKVGDVNAIMFLNLKSRMLSRCYTPSTSAWPTSQAHYIEQLSNPSQATGAWYTTGST